MTSEEGQARETGAGVVGVAFGLFLLASLVLTVAIQGSKPLDPDELLAGSFDVGALPFGLRPVGGAVVATGEKLVALRAGDIEEAPRAETPDEDANATGDDEDESFDWSAVEEGERGTPPVEAWLVWYVPKAGTAAVERLFEDVAWKDLGDFGSEGGRLMTEQDTLVWAGYDAGYVVERELEPGGTFRDWARVNLSLPGRACILFARWARGCPASKEPLDELLAALRPRAEEDTGDDR